MKTYYVEFAIELDAESSIEACQRAWELMTGAESLLPIGTVIELDSGRREDLDLQALAEKQVEA